MSEPFDSSTPESSSAPSIEHRLIDDRAAIVAIAGDLDLVSAPEMRRALHGLLAQGRTQLVLDLSGVEFMDSTALGVMVGVQRRLDADERLAVAQPGPDVLHMFELTGLAAAFRIFPTSELALEYVQGAEGSPSAQARPPLTGDAALTLGIASTAMPFTESVQDQAERWLRVLRRHGEAGVVLASIGVSEMARRERDGVTDEQTAVEGDVIASVTEHAGRIAAQRKSAKVATTDLLLAVMHVYGVVFEHVLAAHGGDIDELAVSLASRNPATADR